MLAAVVIGALVVVAVVLTRDDSPSLPHFAEKRPAFATITMRATFDSVVGDTTVIESESDAGAQVVHIKGSQESGSLTATPTVEAFEFIVSADEFWFYDTPTSQWVKAARSDASGYLQLSLPMVTLMVSDYVPDALRRYTTLVSVSDETVRTRELKVYDLRINAVAYQNASPDDYEEWALRVGLTEAKRNLSLELSVDADGVVWRVRSIGSTSTGLSLGDFEQFVMELSEQTFEPPYPDSYFDEATGTQVG